jgi:hypothetical protein
MKRTSTAILCLMLIIFLPRAYANNEQEDFFKITPSEIKLFLEKSPSLTGNELNQLVADNTLVGHTCHSNSVYELLFEKDGTLIFRKSRDPKQIYIGKWWVKGRHIFSQWKHYLKKPTVNEIEYHHLMSNVYVPYNVNEACGPAGTYGLPFMVFKGDPFDLKASLINTHKKS